MPTKYLVWRTIKETRVVEADSDEAAIEACQEMLDFSDGAELAGSEWYAEEVTP